MKVKLFLFLLKFPLLQWALNTGVILLIQLFFIKNIYAEENTYWQIMNPGRILLSDHVSTAPENLQEVDKGVVEYPEFVKRIAGTLLNAPTMAEDNDGYSSDGNSTSSDEPSNVVSDLIKEHFYETVLRYPESVEETAKKSLEYVNRIISSDKWASTKEELADRNAPINLFLEEFKTQCTVETQKDAESVAHIVAAVSLQNSMRLNNITFETHKENLVPIFMSVQAQLYHEIAINPL